MPKLKSIKNPNIQPDIVVDLHCHPFAKPYGHSHGKKRLRHSANAKQKNSVWFYDPPNTLEKLLNKLPGGLTKFTQSDMTTQVRGQNRVIMASLYPLEKGFLIKNGKSGPIRNLLNDLAAGFSYARMEHLRTMKDYFTDLENMYEFYKALDGKEVNSVGGRYAYHLINNREELESILEDEQDHVAVILTIEGAQVLNTGLGEYVDGWTLNKKEVLENIQKIKAWNHVPFFMTFAHHFNNDLCGHAPSVSGIVKKLTDQSTNLDVGFLDFGYEVLDALLNTNDKRIYIDMKHMSAQSRLDYYAHLEKEYAHDDIPLIVSHGACTGLRSHSNRTPSNAKTSRYLKSDSINFYDEELVAIAKSNGIFGIQLDERRVSNKAGLRDTNGGITRRQILYRRAKLIWNNIQHIAEVLDQNGLYPWGIQSIGSDFDGIVNPINGYWTAEDYQYMDNALILYAEEYLRNYGGDLKNNGNTTAEEIVDRFMGGNAMDFIDRYFQ